MVSNIQFLIALFARLHVRLEARQIVRKSTFQSGTAEFDRDKYTQKKKEVNAVCVCI